MSDLVTVIVKCRRGKELIASYPLSYARTIGPSSPPPTETFVAEAKSNLTTEGLAFPPYEGIKFEVVRS
jgi:hypothetical protein